MARSGSIRHVLAACRWPGGTATDQKLPSNQKQSLDRARTEMLHGNQPCDMLILNAAYHPALAVRFRTGSLVTRLEPPTCQDSASDGASFRAACFGPASNSALGGPASDSTVITGPEPASNSKVNRSPTAGFSELAEQKRPPEAVVCSLGAPRPRPSDERSGGTRRRRAPT